jgi:hypothetical protein
LAHVNTLAACLVNAAVKNGWVTLTGFVQWQYQRQDAAHVVRFLRDVVGLSNEIADRPGAGTTVSSSGIESALRRSSSRLAKDITVTVVDGDVTLTGAIHSWIERDQAMHCAWGNSRRSVCRRPDEPRLPTSTLSSSRNEPLAPCGGTARTRIRKCPCAAHASSCPVTYKTA